MSTRDNFNTAKVIRTNPAFPQAVIANGFIFLSGMAGFDPITGKVASDSFEEQTIQAFKMCRQFWKKRGVIYQKW